MSLILKPRNGQGSKCSDGNLNGFEIVEQVVSVSARVVSGRQRRPEGGGRSLPGDELYRVDT